MLKQIFIISITILLMIIDSSLIFANSEKENNFNRLNNIYYETGMKDVIEKYTCDDFILDDMSNFTSNNTLNTNNKLLSLSPAKIISFLYEIAKNEIKKPLKVAMGVIGIIIVSSIMEALKICFSNNSLNEVINCVCVLSIFIAISKPLLECIKFAIDSIINTSNFMLSFIPIYTGIMSTCGLTITGGVYNSFLFFACQTISNIISTKLLPIMGIYMAFCLVTSLAPNLNISCVAKTVKNIVTWVLGFIITAFIGLITVQGVVSCSVDTIGTKAAKFLIGSSIPVIGGVISDAYTSVKGCFDFIRSSMGAVSIVIVVGMFLPILVRLIIWSLTVKISGAMADLMGVNQVSQILKSNECVIGLLFAIIVSFILLIVISMTILLILGLGLH